MVILLGGGYQSDWRKGGVILLLTTMSFQVTNGKLEVGRFLRQQATKGTIKGNQGGDEAKSTGCDQGRLTVIEFRSGQKYKRNK